MAGRGFRSIGFYWRTPIYALHKMEVHGIILPAAAKVEKLTGEKPKKYKDYRELLDKEIQSILDQESRDQ